VRSPASRPGPAPRSSAPPALLAAAFSLATLAIYARVSGFQFLHYDDPAYVTRNPHVRAGLSIEGLRWAFTSIQAANWHPLTWLSHMADWQCFGEHAGGHHLMSVALHMAAALAAFAAWLRMTGARGRSAFVAGVFALHPLHVESVAWISERKDVLCGLFWFLTLLAYADYAKRPRAGPYVLVVAGFALALQSKPMAVTLPLVLLLLDVWPLRRWDPPGRTPVAAGSAGFAGGSAARLVVEKLPLVALAAATGVITVIAQRAGGAVISTEAIPPGLRVANALTSVAAYIGKSVWPHPLALFYPWRAPAPAAIGLATLVVAGISALAWRVRRSRPYVAVGWGWFVITLLPVIGLIQVGGQALADRYTYIPQTGLALIAAFWVPELPGFRSRTLPAAAAALVALAACAAVTSRQLDYWRDGFTLFEHSARVTADNYEALTELGIEWHVNGNTERAMMLYDRAVKIKPSYALAQGNLGLALAQLGRTDEAIPHLIEAIRLKPDFGDAHRSLGIARAEESRFAEAEAELREALRLDPDDAIAHAYLADVLAERGDVAAAVAEYRRALALRPGYARAEAGLRRLGAGAPR